MSLLVLAGTAGVSLFRFWTAEKEKTLAEANQLSLSAGGQIVLRELWKNPSSHPELLKELMKLWDNLSYRPASTVKLDVYERAAFGIMVDVYAVPINTSANLAAGQVSALAAAEQSRVAASHEKVKKGQTENTAELLDSAMPGLRKSIGTSVYGHPFPATPGGSGAGTGIFREPGRQTVNPWGPKTGNNQ